MFATTLSTALVQYSYNMDDGVKSVEAGASVGILVVISSVHFFQFLGMSFQLFARSWLRKKAYAPLMGLLQAFFLMVLPILLIITQIFLLIFTRAFKETIYYKWTIADIVINCFSIWSFILAMQTLTFEHAQNSVSFE